MLEGLCIVAAVVAVLAAIGWQNRLNLLLRGLPIVIARAEPIQPNQPITWQRGPDAAVEPGDAADERPPNIILIVTDDMGFNDVSLYNGGSAGGSLMTPNIDAIAHEGVRFNQGYAANAICAPSRATIMTGRYSTRFGFEFTPSPGINATLARWMSDLEKPVHPVLIDEEAAARLPPFETLGLPPSEITIAELLQDAGYHTAHIGKWHLGLVDGMHPLDQGFDESLNLTGLLHLPEDHPEAVNAKRLNEASDRVMWALARYATEWNRTEAMEPSGYLTDYFTDEAVEVIHSNRHQPFFLYLAHWAPHNPMQAKKSDYDALGQIEDHHMRVYAAMLKSLDRSVEKITAALAENDLTEDTLILFTSDNGAAGYVGLPDLNRPYRGWKLNHFEGGIHVPFMAKWPARVQPGTVVDSPVHHADLFHTIAAAAGVAVPGDRKLDGVDLLPYVNGEREGRPHDTLFWRQGHHQSVLHEGWKLIRADKPDNARWLFHLTIDPTEQRNLASAEPEKLAELETLLAAHNSEQASPRWPSYIDRPQRIDGHHELPHAGDGEYIYWPE
ncbi:MAG: sulfatase-like hydrolase/transferase [Acidobacteriota bacterium]